MKENNIGKNINKGEIVIYQTSKKKVELKVRLEKETVWLTQKQMAVLFGKGIPTINEHIKNIFKEGELQERSVIRKFRITATDGKIYGTQFYNLDVIISVGYRVKSYHGTQFRIWATKTLKEHLVKGYTINQKRLLETREKFKELQSAIAFLQEKSKRELLSGQTGEILNLLSNYAKTLTLLGKYDKRKLKTAKGEKAKFVLKYKECQRIVREIKKELISKKEASRLFGQGTGGEFEGIVKNLYQTFSGKELYKTIESQAAHLLYFVIKDHPFIDGNKRIASFLFVYFLDRNDYLYRNNGEKKISDNALTALSLLIAVSDPKEKDILIKIVVNLIDD